MSTQYTRTYAAVCYGAREAKEASWGTDITEALGHVAWQVAHGDNNALGVLADMVEERDLPAANLIRRAFNGEGERDPHEYIANWVQPGEHNSLRTVRRTLFRKPTDPEFESYPFIPGYYVILPKTDGPGKGFTGGQRAVIRADYFNHPTGHYWLLSFNTRDPHPTRRGATVRRDFLLPTTTEELTEHAQRLSEIGTVDATDAEHIIRTMKTPHPEQH